MKDLLLLALGTHRVTKLVIDDEIFHEPREAVLDRLGRVDSPLARKAEYFLTCPWCVSIWAGGGLALLRAAAPGVFTVVAGALAASSVTGLVYERT